VANDKGIGARESFECDYNVCSYNTHQDNGTVSIVPVPNSETLATMTSDVYEYNHWNRKENIESASGGSPHATPVAIPERIGAPSLIKHVFMIIRENRTYDQMLGDVAAGNGDPSLAVFGDGAVAGGTPVTPNVHALVKRFPLLDNFYDPSRQSADGHQWIMEGMAPYADDIQSPDWVRSYPGGNAGDALAYQNKGFLFSEAAAAGLPVKIYGEYVENDTFLQPNGSTSEPSWSQFYADSQCFEGGPQCAAPGTPGETTLYYQNTVLPAVRSGHSRPVPRRSVAAGLQQRRKSRYGARIEPPVDHGRSHRRPAGPDRRRGRQRLGRWAHYRLHQPQQRVVLVGDLHRRRRRAERRRPRRRSSEPRLYRQPIRRAKWAH
jgi:hypothetical protein